MKKAPRKVRPPALTPLELRAIQLIVAALNARREGLAVWLTGHLGHAGEPVVTVHQFGPDGRPVSREYRTRTSR